MKHLMRIVLLTAGILLIFTGVLFANTVTGVRSLPTFYFPGESVDVSVVINVDESNKPNALILKEFIPFSWTPLDASPNYLVYNDGELKWLFYDLGTPVQDMIINYSVLVPANENQQVTFAGQLDYNDPANGGASTTEFVSGDTQIAVAPEPISSTLFILGGATLVFGRFRKKIKE